MAISGKLTCMLKMRVHLSVHQVADMPANTLMSLHASQKGTEPAIPNNARISPSSQIPVHAANEMTAACHHEIASSPDGLLKG